MMITDSKKIEAMANNPDRYVVRGETHDDLGEYYIIIDDIDAQTTHHVLTGQWPNEEITED